MTKFIETLITGRWEKILEEYELVKQKRSNLFKNVKELCLANHVSGKTLNKYYSRWIMSNKKTESLMPRRRGPLIGKHRMLSKEQERIIIKIQREFEAKPLDVWCMIKNVWEIHPSVKTISRILRRYPQKKKKEIIHRYEKKIPGELVHADTFNLPRDLFLDRKPRFLSGIIDDCTRLTYVEPMSFKKALDTGQAFMRGCKWLYLHGIEIEKLMTDRGAEYTNIRGEKLTNQEHFFEMLLEYADIKHIYTKPYTPKTNGKIERFWRILREEFLNGLHQLTEEEFKQKLKDFMYYYNYQRPHGGILFKSPLEKLKFITETLG